MEAWGTEETLAVLALLLLAGLVLGARKVPKRLRYVFLARYSILVAAAVVGLPIVAVWGPTGAQRLLRNLFALGPGGLLAVTPLVTIASWVAMATADLTSRYAELRFGVAPPEPARRWWEKWLERAWGRRLPIALGLTLPTLVAVFVASPSETLSPLPATGAVLAGWVLALVLLLVAAAIQSCWRRSRTGLEEKTYPTDTLLLPAGTPWRARLVAVAEAMASPLARLGSRRSGSTVSSRPHPQGLFREGYRQEGRWLEGHFTAFSFFIVTVVLYVAGFFALHPARARVDTFPSLGYVYFILIFLGWTFPGIAFFLDRYRVPTTLVAIAVSFSLSTILGLLAPGSDHGWEVTDRIVRGSTPGSEPAAEGAEGPEGEPVEIYVAASGGGITAALWTARVLAGLQEEAGARFTSSLRLISAVSGGGVGTLHYLDRWEDGKPPSPTRLEESVQAAGASSLSATAWGLAYPDLWRSAGLPFYLLQPEIDRGWAMEQAWRKRLDPETVMLSDWQREVAAGRLPGAVFNATVAETGEPFRFSSLDLPEMGGRDFGASFPDGDVDVVTAARLSATFPWVSPLARPRRSAGDGSDFHLGDGGYYDSYGVATLAELLNRELDLKEKQEVATHGAARARVLLIQIRSGSELGEDPGPDPLSGWLAAAVGPVSTLLATRSAGQRLRNSLELGEVVERLREGCTPVVQAYFQLDAPEPPLSWKLTRMERNEIENAWNRNVVDPDSNLFQESFKVRCALDLESGEDCEKLLEVGEGCDGDGDLTAAEAANAPRGAVQVGPGA